VFRGPAYRFGIRLQRVVTRVAHYLIYRAARYTQGVHADGWATRRAHLWFPNRGAGRVVLDIERPDWPGLTDQTLRVEIGGRTRVLELGPGLERYVVDAPAPALASEPLKIRLLAARTVPESAASTLSS